MVERYLNNEFLRETHLNIDVAPKPQTPKPTQSQEGSGINTLAALSNEAVSSVTEIIL